MFPALEQRDAHTDRQARRAGHDHESPADPGRLSTKETGGLSAPPPAASRSRFFSFFSFLCFFRFFLVPWNDSAVSPMSPSSNSAKHLTSSVLSWKSNEPPRGGCGADAAKGQFSPVAHGAGRAGREQAYVEQRRGQRDGAHVGQSRRARVVPQLLEKLVAFSEQGCATAKKASHRRRITGCGRAGLARAMGGRTRDAGLDVGVGAILADLP